MLIDFSDYTSLYYIQYCTSVQCTVQIVNIYVNHRIQDKCKKQTLPKIKVHKTIGNKRKMGVDCSQNVEKDQWRIIAPIAMNFMK